MYIVFMGSQTSCQHCHKYLQTWLLHLHYIIHVVGWMRLTVGVVCMAPCKDLVKRWCVHVTRKHRFIIATPIIQHLCYRCVLYSREYTYMFTEDRELVFRRSLFLCCSILAAHAYSERCTVFSTALYILHSSSQTGCRGHFSYTGRHRSCPFFISLLYYINRQLLLTLPA